MSKVMVSSEGSASTSSVDMLRSRLLPSGTTPKKLSATSTALLVKLHTLMTASLMPSARRLVRHCSTSPDVLNGDGRHDGGMNLMHCVRTNIQACITAQRQRAQARAYGRSIHRRNVLEISRRCSLVKLEKVASLVSMAYTRPLNTSA